MQLTLTLNSKIWNKGLKSAVNKHFSGMAKRLESKLKSNIDTSRPAGRLYRRGPITARRTAAFDKLGFKVPRGKEGQRFNSRNIVGYKVHRASAWGQPPARDTSTLYRSLKVRRGGAYGITASVKAKGVRILDSPTDLNRPFFKPVIRTFYIEEFRPELQKEIMALKDRI